MVRVHFAQEELGKVGKVCEDIDICVKPSFVLNTDLGGFSS